MPLSIPYAKSLIKEIEQVSPTFFKIDDNTVKIQTKKRNCKGCGKEIGRFKNCKYCLECVRKINKESCHKWYLKNRYVVLKKMRNKYQKKTTYKLCLFCNKKFIVIGKKKYCCIECRKKYLDAHKLENREKRKKYENIPQVREKRREYDRKHRIENIEKFKKKDEKYYNKHKEEILIRNKKHYHKCLDCDKLIVPKAKRCHSCAMKERKKNGFILSSKSRKKLSKRMKKNNPMKNPKIAKKVKDTNRKNGSYEKVRVRMLNGGGKKAWESMIKNGNREYLYGEKHPNWRGGISFEPYDINFNNKFKRAIRKRDNQICMLCGIHREKLKRALDVHHIDYNKLLSIPQNCVSLCTSCHTKTNWNRKNWTKFFQSLLAEKYGYIYNKNQEIVLEVKNGQTN